MGLTKGNGELGKDCSENMTEDELEGAITSALQHVEIPPIPRRVKVYEMENDNWSDCGTGYCNGLIEDSLAYFIVYSESDNESVLLKTQIVAEDIYTRQEETLIVWQELNGTDLALSFQESIGCIDMWMFLTNVQKAICSVTGNISNDDILTDDGTAHERYFQSVSLPSPELSNLPEIEEVVFGYMHSVHTRDHLVRYLSNEDYVARLIELFPLCEDLENTDDLHRLCSIIKCFVQLNDAPLLESLVSNDEKLMTIAGILEYDPEFPNIKANHREYLTDTSKFKQVVPIRDPRILAKIHQTFKLQYLRDVIISRIVDEPSFSVLNSFIFFNQADIIQYLQTNKCFLLELFSIYTNDASDDEKKQEGIFFIQQVCNIAKSLQFQSCSALFVTFVKYNLLQALEYAMSSPKNNVRNAGSDILVSIIDQDPAIIWQKFDQDRKDDSSSSSSARISQHSLLSNLIKILHREANPGVLAQITEAFRILLSLPGNYAFSNPYRNADGTTRSKADSIVGLNFIDNFYDNSFTFLADPLLKLTKPEDVDESKLDLYVHLCELFSYFFKIHEQWTRQLDTYKVIASKIAFLLKSSKKYVVLSGLRFFRSCLAARQGDMSSIMLEHDIFGKILELMVKVRDETDLLNSATLEFFEYIRSDGSEKVLDHLNKHYRTQMESLSDFSTFSEILQLIDSLSSGSESFKSVSAHDPTDLDIENLTKKGNGETPSPEKSSNPKNDNSKSSDDTGCTENKLGIPNFSNDSPDNSRQSILEDRYFLESAMLNTESNNTSEDSLNRPQNSKRKSDFNLENVGNEEESPKKRIAYENENFEGL
ncbi:DNA damage response protein [Schizosaccharomyces cryophilus OY26]|uniref:DNA damage response protein n=1 Tax=Schizosaccharomyces cryophilus (strain OY26 / ATCC MYA-4695 / CBS 11777 / NBRC 106824 / NRRL Y48691) TaxID=653667 RepID=S9W2L8_SCHCR|nr:DNA damage response protein [Schizosaccharomyces cryophilus OY26]EPY54283.1 DNA damage response protein [Schizosaccharomyces cryophilus OY26]